MTYIDGYLLAVPEANKQAYKELAELAAPLFIAHGAVHVVETWGDDLVKGKTTDFFMATKAEEGETVVFSWVVWPDKAARDKGNASIMEDERYRSIGGQKVFDLKRMMVSGFQTLLDLKA